MNNKGSQNQCKNSLCVFFRLELLKNYIVITGNTEYTDKIKLFCILSGNIKLTMPDRFWGTPKLIADTHVPAIYTAEIDSVESEILGTRLE